MGSARYRAVQRGKVYRFIFAHFLEVIYHFIIFKDFVNSNLIGDLLNLQILFP